MRIITQGIDPNTVEYQATCSKCTTVFGFHLSDPEVTADSDTIGHFYMMSCPLCHHNISIARTALEPVTVT